MAKIKEVITTANTHNILTAGTRITGNVSTEEDIRIDGSIEGNVNCKGKIIIGTESKITGDIECSNIEISGQVNGNILCFENVILRSSSYLTGNIKASTLEIEPGARFDGNCSMYKGE